MRVVHTSRARVDAMVLLSLAKHVRNTRAGSAKARKQTEACNFCKRRDEPQPVNLHVMDKGGWNFKLSYT